MKKTRVLMFRTHDTRYDPRVRSEAESLMNAGYEVTLIEWDRSGDRKTRENIYGMDVIRVKNTKLMKLIPYDILRLRFWWKEAFKTAENLHQKDPFDIVHCHDLDTLPIGVRLKKKYGTKLIYDAAEVWTYMVKGEVPNFLIEKFRKMEKKFMRDIDAFITVDEKYKEYFISIGYPKEKINIIMNAKRLIIDEYVPPNNKIPEIIYLGSLHRNRLIMELIEAVKDRGDVKVTIGGMGYLEKEVKNMAAKSKNVEFIGVIPMDKVIEKTMESDAVYCMFDPSHPITRIGSPNKFFEALVCGRPLLVSKGTYVGELVEKLKCGIVAEASVDGIRNAVDFIAKNPKTLEEMGKNALSAAKNGYNWERQEQKLLEIYHSLSDSLRKNI